MTCQLSMISALDFGNSTVRTTGRPFGLRRGVPSGSFDGVGDALGRGATRFLLRLAGLPSLRLEVRSTTFEVR